MSEISKKTKSENERINLLVFIFATLMDAFFVVGYLQDASVGNISWTYAIIVVAVVAVGLLINAVLYIRNHGSVALRHTVMVGYGVLYAVIMYGANSDLVFIAAFPMASIFILYTIHTEDAISAIGLREVRAVRSTSVMSFYRERQMLHWLPVFFTSEKLKFPN